MSTISAKLGLNIMEGDDEINWDTFFKQNFTKIDDKFVIVDSDLANRYTKTDSDNLYTKKVQAPWINMPLINNWVWYGSGAFPAYYVDDRNFLHMKGIVRDGLGSGGVGIARLPVGARPASDRKFMVWDGANNVRRIDIQTDGYIIIPLGWSVNNAYVTLDFPPVRLT
jgi:hypothetical protein